jgi:hypothetical protein
VEPDIGVEGDIPATVGRAWADARTAPAVTPPVTSEQTASREANDDSDGQGAHLIFLAPEAWIRTDEFCTGLLR